MPNPRRPRDNQAGHAQRRPEFPARRFGSLEPGRAGVLHVRCARTWRVEARRACRSAVRPADPALVHEVDMVDQAEAFQSPAGGRRDDAARRHRRRRGRRAVRGAGGASSPRPSTRACRSIARRLDDPVGVVHVKDVFRLMANDDTRPGATDQDPAPAASARRSYVPASMRAADLLLRMRDQRASTWPWSSTSSAAPTAWSPWKT